MNFRNMHPVRLSAKRPAITLREIGIAAAGLVLPPLLIGAVLYYSLAPFDDDAVVHQAAPWQAPDLTGTDGARAPADDTPTDDLRIATAPAAVAPSEAMPPATPARRSMRRRARPQAQAPQDDFPQKMKGWLRDIGFLPRTGATAEANR